VNAVAYRSGCPPASLRFRADSSASAAGSTWNARQPAAPDDLQHLGDGQLLLLVAIGCNPDVNDRFLAVLERQADGSFRAVDAIRPPGGTTIVGWRSDAAG
jgi:hypothetical protein